MDPLIIAGTVFAQPWLWFSQLLESTGSTGIYVVGLSMLLAFKFLVAPFLGVYGDALSDAARKKAVKTIRRTSKSKFKD